MLLLHVATVCCFRMLLLLHAAIVCCYCMLLLHAATVCCFRMLLLLHAATAHAAAAHAATVCCACCCHYDADISHLPYRRRITLYGGRGFPLHVDKSSRSLCPSGGDGVVLDHSVRHPAGFRRVAKLLGVCPQQQTAAADSSSRQQQTVAADSKQHSVAGLLWQHTVAADSSSISSGQAGSGLFTGEAVQQTVAADSSSRQ
eukprot:3910199-Rhodomonas_salina.2